MPDILTKDKNLSPVCPSPFIKIVNQLNRYYEFAVAGDDVLAGYGEIPWAKDVHLQPHSDIDPDCITRFVFYCRVAYRLIMFVKGFQVCEIAPSESHCIEHSVLVKGELQIHIPVEHVICKQWFWGFFPVSAVGSYRGGEVEKARFIQSQPSFQHHTWVSRVAIIEVHPRCQRNATPNPVNLCLRPRLKQQIQAQHVHKAYQKNPSLHGACRQRPNNRLYGFGWTMVTILSWKGSQDWKPLSYSQNFLGYFSNSR